MRESSLVLSADVLQVKQVSGGDGRHRIVICTATNVDWPVEKSVRTVRDALVKRKIGGINHSSISMPMRSCKDLNILLVISLEGMSERKAKWYRFEIQRVVNGHPHLAIAKNPSPHKGKHPQYVNRSAAIFSAAAAA